MAGSNNFLQHNPGASNQENDATYSTDTTRTGGIGVDQILPSPWLNKVWYQCTTMVAGLGQALANKGYAIADTSLATLASVLANILTAADFTISIGSIGYIKFPSTLGGLVIEWGLVFTSGNYTGTFPLTFPNAVFGGVVGDNGSYPNGKHALGFTPTSTSGYGITDASGGTSAFWIAIGH